MITFHNRNHPRALFSTTSRVALNPPQLTTQKRASAFCSGNTLLHCIRKELPVTDPVGGQLGKALRSDAYVGFREGQLTLVNYSRS